MASDAIDYHRRKAERAEENFIELTKLLTRAVTERDIRIRDLEETNNILSQKALRAESLVRELSDHKYPCDTA